MDNFPFFMTTFRVDGLEQPREPRTRRRGYSATNPSNPSRASRSRGRSATLASAIPDEFRPGSDIVPDRPIYIGSFDMYAMSLPFLVNIYLPSESGPPRYEELYHKLVQLQAKPDYTSRCFLEPPPDPTASTAIEGRFESVTIKDPISKQPYDVAIKSILVRNGPFSLTTTDREYFPAIGWMPLGPGISGKTSLAQPQFGIKTSNGAFKMKRVWSKLTENGEILMELFEGFFSFNLSFGPSYVNHGYDSNANYRYAFWAIRARISDGREVGLGPRPEED